MLFRFVVSPNHDQTYYTLANHYKHLLQYRHRLELSNLYIYKLAVISNMKLQSLSSCGDIAVSVYSGWLAYSTFDHDWVKQQIETTSVNTVLEKNWPGLHIEPLHKKPDRI
jgi:ERG8-type phosphomevalonate kinase